MDSKALIQLAYEATKSAYAPYSKFFVGAALLASSGKIYKGCNIENSSFGVTICAERVAIATAIANGERDFEMIAIAASSNEFVYPCGNCRQFMSEFGINLTVVVAQKDNIREHKLRELLPYAFVSFESTDQQPKLSTQPNALL